jgi:hypothetical protein
MTRGVYSVRMLQVVLQRYASILYCSINYTNTFSPYDTFERTTRVEINVNNDV